MIAKAGEVGRNLSRGGLRVMAAIAKRLELATKLGQSYGTDRDIYAALGYKTAPDFQDYYAFYSRLGIAGRIVDAYPEATWRGEPTLTDPSGDDSQFIKAWKELEKRLRVWHYFNRVDKVAGIGRYAVLLLGFQDGAEDLAQPVESAKDIMYLSPYSESHAAVLSVVEDAKDARFGLPETYNLTIKKGQTMVVHWTRILHVAEGLEEDDVFGRPRLQRIYNRLRDIEKIVGGSAEMFWRGAFPPNIFLADEESELDDDQQEALEDQMDALVHDLKRYAFMQGVKPHQMTVQVASPKEHMEVQWAMISAATGIPVRVLTGSERGELASSQDDKNWNSRVDERRRSFAEPSIVRGFVGRLQGVGILPEAGGEDEDYAVEWPELLTLDPKEEADVMDKMVKTLVAYAKAPEAQLIVPPDQFLAWFMNMSDEQIEQLKDAVKEELRKERRDFAPQQTPNPQDDERGEMNQ